MPGRAAALRPWAAALAGGLAGTTALTATLAVESRLLHESRSAVDYDASEHVVTAACRLLRHPVPSSRTARTRIFNLVHWGYGSAVAVEYEALRRVLPTEMSAAAAFYCSAQTMAFVLFPMLGGTPPPWRWDRAVLRSSMTAHAVYTVTVAGVSRRLR